MKMQFAACILFVFLCSVCIFTDTQAQHQNKTRKPAEQRAEALTLKFKKQLNLNADQLTKVKAINLDKAQKVDALRERLAGKEVDKEVFMTERKTIRDAREAAITALLTPAQKAKFEAVRKRAEAKRAHRRMKTKNKPQNPVQDTDEEGEDEDDY
jgi:uncharacterized membrane protein